MSRSDPSLHKLGKACDVARLSASHTRNWRPGLAAPSHNEVFASGEGACGAGFALLLARDGLRVAAKGTTIEKQDHRAILWVQDQAAVRLTGRPYRHGLSPELRHRLIHVEAKNCKDALFALEEGLRCRDLAFVLGEVAGNPKEFDFTASRRLSLTAEKHGVPLWLVRLDAGAELSSARMRWRVEAAPSPPGRWNRQAPGIASWQAELFRARSHAPGKWILRDDEGSLIASGARRPATPDHVDLVGAAFVRSLAAVQ